jgi:hypothetical protein
MKNRGTRQNRENLMSGRPTGLPRQPCGLPRDDTFSFPCHCEPRSGVAIQPDTLASRTTIQTGSPRRPLRAFLAMTLSLFYCPCGEQSGKASLAHASPPCHCEPRSGVAIQSTLWHPGLRYRLDCRVDPFGLPRKDRLNPRQTYLFRSRSSSKFDFRATLGNAC